MAILPNPLVYPIYLMPPPAHSLLGTALPADLHRSRATVHIVGGGISGLMLAYQLHRRSIPIILYERSERVGGWLSTRQSPYGIIEGAANGLMRCIELDAMVADLGLAYQMPLATNTKRYVVRGGQLRRMPLGISEILQAAARFLLPHRPTKPLATLRDFVDTYLSPVAALQLLEPAMLGIDAAPLSELSFSLVLPDLARIQPRYASLPWAMLVDSDYRRRRRTTGGTVSFAGGMQSLVDALERRLQAHIRYNTDGINNLDNIAPHDVRVLCTPAYESARFFGQHPLADLLRQVRYIPMLSATFFVSQETLKRFKAGFGCVIPRNENYHTLGVLFNHCIFEGRVAQPNLASLTCIAQDSAATQHLDEASILDLLTNELERLLGLDAPPLYSVLRRYHHGIPLYSPELNGLLPQISAQLQRDWANVRLFGNYTGQISIRGMGQSAARATEHIG
ncbi:MAG: FAD-dependent oxidoreductase [Sphingobacteriales bacterium]|nr:FAD-dependent oxidoreductase [Sphingobacteriales bacterium]